MKKKILIVASNYYKKITKNLIFDATRKLNKKYILKKIIVPGTFEIPMVISKNIRRYDGFIVLGCVIKGKTPHFEYLCFTTFNSLMNLSVKYKKPIGNGILTCLNMSQALTRSKIKGKESAEVMINLLA